MGYSINVVTFITFLLARSNKNYFSDKNKFLDIVNVRNTMFFEFLGYIIKFQSNDLRIVPLMLPNSHTK